jgi:hypothetical protein
VADAERTQTRPFAAVLQELRAGLTHAELSDRLVELVTACQATGKGGSITFTLSVKPTKGESGVMVVTDKIAAKIPEGERGEGIFFSTIEGNLVRQDPRQQELPLREVQRPQAREAGA